MSLALGRIETALKSRLRILGAFTASESVARMREAISMAALEIWNRKDWDFKNSTATLTTSQGTLGPYNAPSGLVRFAAVRKVAAFGFRDAQTLAPILSTDVKDWTPYLVVQDGSIYFFEDPGTGNLTLNYLGDFDDSMEEANLTALVALFPSGLKNGFVTIACADVLRDIPGRTAETDANEKRGLQYVDDYWEMSTMGTVQTQIAPKGLGRQQLDGYARTLNVIGELAARFETGLT